MQYLFLLFAILVLTSQKMLMKQYEVKSGHPNTILFSAIATLFAALFFFVLSGFQLELGVASEVLPYAIGFAIAYVFSIIGITLAIKEGPLSTTTLINSYSLIIPTLYGALILKDSIGITAYIGVILLLFSLFFVNARKESVKLSAKWLFWVLVSFVGNGLCCTIQKMQQIAFEQTYGNEFMTVALGLAFLFQMAYLILCKKIRRSEWRDCFTYAPFLGVANGATNWAVIVLTSLLPNTILFPSLSAGEMLLLFFASIFVYKEKMSKMQMLGYGMGVISIILLNL